jgi:transcriptional regulator with XRE-family HTH domain
MNILHEDSKRDVGVRFTLFRKAIRKSRVQLADELGVPVRGIERVEKGDADPEINYLHYLNKKYGLNINWMFGSRGDMFVENRPGDLDTDYVIRPPVKEGDSRFEAYAEFFQLMQVPAIEKAIMDRLKEIKTHLLETD